MSLDIYINDQLMDLTNPKSIGLTFQVGSVFNIEGRRGNLTNRINLPKTKTNSDALTNLSNINSATVVPYRQNSARVIQNGVELISDGFAVIDATTSSAYSVVIYSGNVSFFDLIKEKNVNELQWDDCQHIFDIPTIISSFTNTSGFIYPIVDFSSVGEPNLLDNTDTQNADALLPCGFVSDFMQKIADEVGYELKGTFVESSQYPRLILTPNSFGFSDDEVSMNVGVSNNVVTLDDSIVVADSIEDPTPFEFSFPLDYQNVVGEQYSENTFTPTNNFAGVFTLNAFGTIDANAPSSTEEIIHTANTGYVECAINDTHAAYIRNRPVGTTGTQVVLYDIDSDTETILDDTTALTGVLSLTETTGGFVAWSMDLNPAQGVKIYEIATSTTTTIYTYAGSNAVENLKIWNGRLSWFRNSLGEGLFMYDFATTITKNVTTQTDIISSLGVFQIDHNGENIVWGEIGLDDVLTWDWTTETQVQIETVQNNLGLSDLMVRGDYVTYWNDRSSDFNSYKFSTLTFTIIIALNPKQVTGATRTDTHVAFGTNQGDLFYYDLVADSLINTTELQSNIENDFDISMNDNFIVYIAETNKKVKVYDIALNTISEIEASTDSYTKVCITANDQIFYHNEGNTDVLTLYNLNTDTVTLTINNIEDVPCFHKAEGNDRLIYSTTSLDDRVAYLNPLVVPIEVDLHVAIRQNGVVVYEDVQTFITDIETNYGITLNTGSIIVQANAVYSADVFLTANRAGTLDYEVEYKLDSSGFKFIPTNQIPYGACVPFGIFWDYKQDQLFKDIMNVYGLLIQTNEITKQVFLNPLNDLEKNLSKAKDWSNKIDFSKNVSIKYRIGNYGQLNYFNYAADDDVALHTGRGSFTIDDQNLVSVQDAIDVTLAASNFGLRVEDNHTPQVPLKDTVASSFEKAKNRILLLDPKDQTVNFQTTVNGDTGQATTNIPFSYFDKFGQTDNLTFTDLIETNYSTFTGMMDQFKFITASFLLKEIDVVNLDFTTPIFLDVQNESVNINGFFYINKISNFKDGSSTKVELIRL